MWAKIDDKKVQPDTFWDKANDEKVKLDIGEIESLFCAAPPPKPTPREGVRVNYPVLCLLDLGE